jgi:hypothetical protein
MAGLGGDTRFLKTDLAARWYYTYLKIPAGVALTSWAWEDSSVMALALPGIRKAEAICRYSSAISRLVSIQCAGFADRSLGPRSPSNCDNDGQNCKEY